MLTHLDLFSGIAGFALAARWTGRIETQAFCEIDPFCRQVIAKNFPGKPIFNDIRILADILEGLPAAERPVFDLITGGFPCQPFSIAGKKQGRGDDRFLWPAMFRVIDATRPSWIVGENVAQFVNMELDNCTSDLEGIGYSVRSLVIPACAVNAPHRRDRTWIIANAGCSSDQRGSECERGCPCHQQGEASKREPSATEVAGCDCALRPHDNVADSNGAGCKKQCRAKPIPAEFLTFERGDWRIVEPMLRRGDHGIPNRVDRLKALGNAIVPQVAYPILCAILESERI